MKPLSATDEGGQLTPAAFRAALASALGVQPVRTLGGRRGTESSPKRVTPVTPGC